MLTLYGVPRSRTMRCLWMLERFRKPLAVLDGALAGRPYLLGDAFTVADLNVACVLSWARLARLDVSVAPAVDAWLERCLARPAFARASPAG